MLSLVCRCPKESNELIIKYYKYWVFAIQIYFIIDYLLLQKSHKNKLCLFCLLLYHTKTRMSGNEVSQMIKIHFKDAAFFKARVFPQIALLKLSSLIQYFKVFSFLVHQTKISINELNFKSIFFTVLDAITITLYIFAVSFYCIVKLFSMKSLSCFFIQLDTLTKCTNLIFLDFYLLL